MGIVLGCAGIALLAWLAIEWDWPEMPTQWE